MATKERGTPSAGSRAEMTDGEVGPAAAGVLQEHRITPSWHGDVGVGLSDLSEHGHGPQGKGETLPQGAKSAAYDDSLGDCRSTRSNW